MACCVFVDLAALENLRLAGQMMNAAIPAASEIIQNAGREPMGQLLHHLAAEQYRYYLPLWDQIQLAGVLALAGLLYFAAEKRVLPQILCLAIFVLVVFQLAMNPELAYRGREADFPPGSLSLGTQERVLALGKSGRAWRLRSSSWAAYWQPCCFRSSPRGVPAGRSMRRLRCGSTSGGQSGHSTDAQSFLE